MPIPLLRIHLFGPLALSRGEQPLALPASAAARSLLAYLALRRERPHPREVLIGQFWPESPTASARRALSRALWQVRRSLEDPATLPSVAGQDVVQAESEHIWIPPAAPLWVDVAEFERLLATAGAQQLGQAVALYRGDLLEGLYDDWALAERERLREAYLAALGRLAGLEKAAGKYEAALEHALL